MVYHSFQTIILPAIITYLVTIISTRFVMRYFDAVGLYIQDKNKEKPVKLLISGLAVAFGIIVGILTYVFGGTFIFVPVLSISNLLAVGLSIILISLVGFLDDLNVKLEKVMTTDLMDTKVGLAQWQKPLLTFLGALPLMAIAAGVSIITVPIFGTVNLGPLYALVVIPLAVIFVSNAFNLLGGYDGIQPGMALIAGVGLLIYCIYFGTYIGALLSAVLCAALLAFLPFNLYRARVIPGDSFTYAIGAILVAIMVLGNAEVFGFIVFFPWFIEFFLHLRRKFNVTDVGIRQKDGTFKAPYGKKIYSLTHVLMNMKRVNELEIAFYLWLIEAVFVLLAFGLKAYGLL